MKKTVITILLTIMAISLSSCGKEADDKGNGDNSKDIAELQKQIDELKAENEELKSKLGETDNNSITEAPSELANFVAETSGVCGPDLTWEYGNGILRIHGTGDMSDYHANLEAYSFDDIKLTGSLPWIDVVGRINHIYIEDGVTSIGDYAFFYCKSVSKAILPSTLKRIGENAFEWTQISSINLPSGLKEIGTSAFENTQLTTIDLPDSLEQIGSRAFSGTTISSVDFPNGIKVIDSAFSETPILSVDLPDGVTQIGGDAFSNCKQLENVHLPDSVEQIDYGAFFGTAISSIDLPDGITQIGRSAFSNCKQLENIHLPDSLEHIGDSAFHSCEKIVNMYLPDGLEYIGNHAFSECVALENINIPDSVSFIGTYAFSGTAIRSVTLPKDLATLGGKAFDDEVEITWRGPDGSNVESCEVVVLAHDGYVNIRTSKGTGTDTVYAIIDTVPNGEILSAFSLDGEWLHVQYHGQIGWVEASQVKLR